MEKMKIIENVTLHVRQEHDLKEAKQGEQSNFWTADVWRLDEKNLNGRTYTRALAERVVSEGIKTMCYDGHDADFTTGHDYAPAIGYCDNPRIEDNCLVVDIHFLESQENSDSVRNIRELHKAGLAIGVSSVGYGTMDADGVVGEDYEVVRYLDFVASPAGLVYADPKEEEVHQEEPEMDVEQATDTVVDGEDKAEDESSVAEAEEVSETSESEVSEGKDAESEADIKENQEMELTEKKLAEERAELEEARKIKESCDMTEVIKKQYSQEAVEWTKKFTEAIAIGSTYSSLVPREIAAQVEMKMDEYGVLRKYCTVHKMAGTYSFAVEDDGATATWKAEGAQVGEATPTAVPIVLTAQSLSALVKVSKELAADSEAMMDYVINSLAKGFAKAEDKAILMGAGFVSGVSYEPSGIITKLKAQLSTPQVVTGTAGTTSTIGFTWTDLKKTIGKIGAHRKGAVLVCNQTTADHIYEMKNGANYIFDQTKPLDNVWGMPVVITDLMDDAFTQASTGADAYPVVVANLSFYHLGDRQDLEISTLNELYAANRQVGVLGDKRLDGNFGNYGAFAAMKIAKAS